MVPVLHRLSANAQVYGDCSKKLCFVHVNMAQSTVCVVTYRKLRCNSRLFRECARDLKIKLAGLDRLPLWLLDSHWACCGAFALGRPSFGDDVPRAGLLVVSL